MFLLHLDDILGISLVMTHFNTKQRQKRWGDNAMDSERNSKNTNNPNSLLPVARIKEIKGDCHKQISLTAFRKDIESSNVIESTNSDNEKSDFLPIDDGGTEDTESTTTGNISTIADHHAQKKRFLPLIINEEHANRALPLLEQELIRMDRMRDNIYEFSLNTVVNSSQSSNLVSIPPHVRLPEFNHIIGMRVISAIMNSAVVSFCKKASQSSHSETLSDSEFTGLVSIKINSFLSIRNIR